MYPLKKFPLLHQFLSELYKRCDVYESTDIFQLIEDDTVDSYCKCGDGECATVYLTSDRLPVLEDEYVESFNSDKGLIFLHFFTDGRIEIEALAYENYPFKDEVIKYFDEAEEVVGYALESDLDYELQQKVKDAAQRVVDNYFATATVSELNTIVLE